MKLGSKTFLYSVIIALIIGIVIFSYMIFLMPGMYMDYKEKQNLENARSSMEYFNNNKSLKNRGNISIFISETLIKDSRLIMPIKTSKPGRPLEYTDELIEFVLTIRELFNKTLVYCCN